QLRADAQNLCAHGVRAGHRSTPVGPPPAAAPACGRDVCIQTALGDRWADAGALSRLGVPIFAESTDGCSPSHKQRWKDFKKRPIWKLFRALVRLIWGVRGYGAVPVTTVMTRGR